MVEKTIYLERKNDNPGIIIFLKDEIREINLKHDCTLGRKTKNNEPDISIESSIVSRIHGKFTINKNYVGYTDLNSLNGSIYNGSELTAKKLQILSDGDMLRIHAINDRSNANDILILFRSDMRKGLVWKKLALDDSVREIVIGRDEGLTLKSKGVSRRHASIFRTGRNWAIIDHASKNGVYVNGKKIEMPVLLSRDDFINIAGYIFRIGGNTLLYQADKEGAAVSAEDVLSVWIEERNAWQRMKKKTLLKDIHMEIPSGNMVLVLGGSGAGKTTFMNAVMGFEPAEGEVRYGNTDIYKEYSKMKYDIGYVPQQDLLRMNDTVYATLQNAARMRLPKDTGDEEYTQAVERAIEKLGLDRVRDSMVVKLSGGQRKRLSIAVEYVGNPSLFFLDEPDSGLDGTMARSLMENLRCIADDGKIVMVISHSPDRAFELFDKVIVLAKDPRDDCGKLAFYGSPKEACRFFETDTLEHVVKRVNNTDEGGEGLASQYIDRFKQLGI